MIVPIQDNTSNINGLLMCLYINQWISKDYIRHDSSPTYFTSIISNQSLQLS